MTIPSPRLQPVALDGPHTTCDGCGRVLGSPDRACNSYCAALARNRKPPVQREPRPCDTCGEHFTPPRSDGRYCSPACRQKAYRQRHREAS